MGPRFASAESPALTCQGPTVAETTTELAHGRHERATCASFAVVRFAADEKTFHDLLECICFVVSLGDTFEYFEQCFQKFCMNGIIVMLAIGMIAIFSRVGRFLEVPSPWLGD